MITGPLPPEVLAVIEEGKGELEADARAEHERKTAAKLAENLERRRFRNEIRDYLQAHAGLPSALSEYVDDPGSPHSGYHRVSVSLPGCEPVFIELTRCSDDTLEFRSGLLWEAVPVGRQACERYASFARAAAVARESKLNEAPSHGVARCWATDL